MSLARALLGRPRRDRADVLSFQSSQLRRLVSHAYRNVPYYRSLFDAHGIRPADIRTAADMQLLPVTSKRDMQVLPVDAVVARGTDPTKLIARRTTGSTGEPLTIRRSYLEELVLGAFRKRALQAYGWRRTDLQAEIEEVEARHPRDHQRLQRVLHAAGLHRRISLHALLPVEEIVRKLRKARPTVVTGYAAVLARVGEAMQGDDLPPLRPRFVATHSEVLTPLMRRQIIEGFGAPVFTLYDSYEMHLIAWECGETGQLHTCDDSVLVEIVRDGRPVGIGERGDVVATALHSLAMPFLRYAIGDIATRGADACSCGAPFATLQTVQGRMFDYFPLPGGRLLHPYEIIALLGDKHAWIRQYQLIQEQRDRIVLRVAPSAPPSAAQLEVVASAIRRLLGTEVRLIVDLVDDLPAEPSSKFRVCRSLVRSEYDGIDWSATGSASPR
ncbi:MAG: phenylacetate--CoA ligase family protein [Gemmatimonadetes bacterium]|nr:phenylacetate--CoA ligase family protein [Gemmatimonadota bacterium]